MRISDEHYQEMIDNVKELQRIADGVDTIEEFTSVCASHNYLAEEESDDYCVIDIDGDLYTIELTEYGLEVEHQVEYINPILRSTETIQLGYEDFE